MAEIIIVGAGPTGVMLACELKLQGVDALVLERDESPTKVQRGLGLHARSCEVLDQRGILDRMLPLGQKYPISGGFGGITKPAPKNLDTNHDYIFGIPQTTVERELLAHAKEIGVEIQRDTNVVSIEQDNDGVQAKLANGNTFHGQYLVGCDGGHSLVRKQLAIGFPGEPATKESILAEVMLTESPETIEKIVNEVRETYKDFGAGHLGHGIYRVVVPAAGVAENHRVPPTLENLREQLRAYANSDFGAHSPRWISRFGNATRLAEEYRRGRILLAGDAAHIHPPYGGQGLNLGLQDAFNLGWKLAAQVNGWAPQELLDTYHSERHPVAADVLTNTRAQGELLSTDPGATALRKVMAELMDFEEVNRHLTEKIIAINIRYDFGSDDLRVGKRLRDRDLRGDRLFELLRAGRGILIDPTGTLNVDDWSDRVDRVVDSQNQSNPSAVLLRPDGHIVWIGDDQSGLEPELERWFGSSR